MTAGTAVEPSHRTIPSTLARELAMSCGASGAAIVDSSSAREIGAWYASARTNDATRECALGGRHRLVLFGTPAEPPSESLRLAVLALEMWQINSSLRANTTRLLKRARASVEINRGICGLGGLDQLLLLVVDRSRDLLHCELAGFALLDECGKEIRWRAMSGARTDAHHHVVYAPDGGVAGRAISTHRPVIVEDFQTDPLLTPTSNPISFAEGLRSVLAVPLDIARRSRGCLMIGYRTPHEFSNEELEMLSSFAAQAAVAVESAELYDRVRRERARVESVVESIDEGLVLIDLSACIALVNRRAENYFDLPRGRFVGRSFEELLAAFGERSADPRLLRERLLSLVSGDRTQSTCDVELSGDPQSVLRFTAFPVFDGDGMMLGRGLLCRDITIERQVDLMKSEVVAIVSHEIRSPLSSIRGCASALLDTSRERTEALRRAYLETIDRESGRLNDLVGNLTDVTMLDAGVLVLALHDSDPTHLVERVVERKRQQNRSIRLEAAQVRGFLRFDHRRIEQVLENLLENAMKYSAPESAIDVTVAYTPLEFVVSVRDRGVGIARPLQERVFERFYRIEGARHKGDGSGLGLYICRGIVKAHAGRIWLESALGEGTTVSFALPRPREGA